jgi:Zn-dependent protease
LAGPTTNLVLSIIGILIILIYSKLLGLSLNDIFYTTSLVNSFWIQFSMINIVLAIFNLIPIPPLEGFRIIKVIWVNLAQKIEKYTLYISIGFLIFIL